MTKKEIRLFLSSPGDVEEERTQVRQIIDRINRHFARERKITIEVIEWKTHVPPEMGPRGQEVINKRIGQYDLFLGIMWKRFGTPTGGTNPDTGEDFLSGTEEEFTLALENWKKYRKPHIFFYFGKKPYSPRNSDEMKQWSQVISFKEECQRHGLPKEYSSSEDFANCFYDDITMLLQDWFPVETKKKKQPPKSPIKKKASTVPVPKAYLSWLAEKLATVELLVTVPKEGFAPPRISSLYVPAPTSAWEKTGKKQDAGFEREAEKIFLLMARFNTESLYVSGIAGCGKSMFTRWTAYLLTQGCIPTPYILAENEQLVEKFPEQFQDKLPLLVPLREFWPYMPHKAGQDSLSKKEFIQALAVWSAEKLENLEKCDLESLFKAGQAVLMLDGVDEIPESCGENKNSYYPRSMLVNGLIEAVPQWNRSGNRILITSRPYGLKDGEAKKLGIPQASISDLPRPLQHLFVRRWFHTLQYEADMAEKLINHLEEREELSSLSGNPVLLMAMCSLFPQDKRLPQDKSELYKMTIDRLLYNRYKTKTEVDLNHTRLSVIAYCMHTGQSLGMNRSTPLAEISNDGIEKVLSEYLQEQPFYEKGQRAVWEVREELLSRSGLLTSKSGDKASFYHLSFQEYLAGRRLIQISCGQIEDFIKHYGDIPEWRQTLVFAFGSALPDTFSTERAFQIVNTLMQIANSIKVDYLLLLADFLEILYGRGLCLQEEPLRSFQRLCLEAIEKKVAIEKRFDLGRILGIVGDPRLQEDLRNDAAYVLIPAGKYKIGDEKKVVDIAKSFLISRYPVTNSQYQLFVNEGGYEHTRRWWSKEGLAWRKKKGVSEPRFWRHGRWNGANFPVVGVSFYEAEAFCAWAGGRLPAEKEWEAAASGPDGLEYPWGNEWKDGICNSYESGLNRTSPVGLFPDSRSAAFALEDMAGDVWEWCSDAMGNDGRVVRGGAFGDDAGWMRCSDRIGAVPVVRSVDLGFRVVRAVQS